MLARGVVDAQPRAARDQERVDAAVHLLRGIGGGGSFAAASPAAELPGVGVVRIVLRAHLIVGPSLRRRGDVHRHDRLLAHEHDAALHCSFADENTRVELLEVGRSGTTSWYACAVTVPSVPGVHATTSAVS